MNESHRMDRRAFLASAGAALVAPGLAFPGAADADARPNVIFVFSDEHRYQSMSFTETPEVHTPVMARMARDGFCFDQCVSNYPVCSPYRGMLMTGRWPFQTGVIDNNIDLRHSEYALGHAFKDAGYRTGYIGKWHLGGTRAEPFGFDVSLIWTNTNSYFDTSVYHPQDGSPVQPRGYNATLMTDQALAFIEDAGSAPYFLALSLNPPHARFTEAPPEARALYPDGSLSLRPNARLDRPDDGFIANQNGTPHYEGYHAHITAVDRELGRILDAVKDSERGRDTIVVYSSDHGTQFGSHGVGSKRQPYEESLRVPFLAWSPDRIPAGARSNALIGTPDMMPTLCGLAGIPVPESCAGQDFSGHILGGAGPEPEAQLIMHIAKDNASGGASHPAPLFRGVRTVQYTYTINEHGPFHLFNNREDPYQMRNLADDPAYAPVRQTLHETLRTLLAAAEDPFPA